MFNVYFNHWIGGCSNSCTTRVWFTEESKSCLSPLPATPPCPTSRPTRTTRFAHIPPRVTKCSTTNTVYCLDVNAELTSSLFLFLSPGRSRPVGDRQLPVGGGWGCVFDRLDDHTLDPAQQPGPLCQPGVLLRQGQRWETKTDECCVSVSCCCWALHCAGDGWHLHH